MLRGFMEESRFGSAPPGGAPWVSAGSARGRRRGALEQGSQQKPPVTGRQALHTKWSLLQSMLPQLTKVSVGLPQCKHFPTTFDSAPPRGTVFLRSNTKREPCQ
eukprot:scaffold260572_cov35-Tisochrysis_lutea.AAC.3